MDSTKTQAADTLDELSKLALKYGADKWSRKHNYTPIYYKLFKDKQKSVKKVLEIGIGGKAASLKMWRDFFPSAKIYGVDYMSSRLINDYRIESILCDQRRKEHLLSLVDKTGPDIDIVIDDGSHRPRDQVFTCLTLMSLLKNGVTYIIEDVAEPSIIERLSQYDVQIPKLDQFLKRYDNRLVVVRHKKLSKNKHTNISFFAKKPNHAPPDGHLQRVSTIVRAYQIAQYIGAKVNPTEGYENDACIYVKPARIPEDNYIFQGKPFLDICDAYYLFDIAKKHPSMPVISTSDWNYQTLKRLLPNKIINIPEQHCNFERIRKNKKGITAVGCIGTYRAFPFLPKGLKESLAKRNIELVEFSKFFTREDVVDFYMNINVQIVWRPYADYRKDILMNPRKIVNASSFGVPTIAYDEPSFKEMEGCYLGVRNLDEFLSKLDDLISSPSLYDEYSQRCLKKAEDYHIENIAKLYLDLK